MTAPTVSPDPRAFPTLDDEEMQQLQQASDLVSCAEYGDGQVIYRAGVANMTLYVVKSGGIDIFNPANNHEKIASHGPRQFSGDIDLLTGRPVIVDGIAKGHTELLQVKGGESFRKLLNKMPKLSQKVLEALQARRQLLEANGIAGIHVIGPADCPATNEVREFLYKNFVPFQWDNSDSPEGKQKACTLKEGAGFPIVELRNGETLTHPTLQELGQKAGIWKGCPNHTVDLAIVGAGPAGLAAGVYAASEGLGTLVLDCLGPGGQAGASSRIENFIGFPTGLSGTELATRGVLQLLKFGGKMIAPVHVDRIEPGETPDSRLILHLDCGTRITAGAVLAATGVKWRQLDAKGAKQFERAGIYHACTTVESTLCDGQPVAVVGGGNSAGQAAVFLAELCRERTVHLILRGPSLEAKMSQYLCERVAATKNIELRLNSEVTAVHGDKELEEITVREGGKQQTLKCKAVFVFIGAEPNTTWIPKGVARDDHGYLLAGADVVRAKAWKVPDRAPCPLETSMPRLLAGGDIRSGSTKRVGFAVGDGSLAVTCAHYLQAQETGRKSPAKDVKV